MLPEPTRAQNEAIDELRDQYDVVGVARQLPIGTRILVTACFAYPDDDQAREPVEADRFRILPNGMVLGVLDGGPGSDLEIPYPAAA